MAKPIWRKRDTARGIVLRSGQILLMERWNQGVHYFSIPGGGIEPGEAPEETVAREIAEETTIEVKVQKQVLEMHDGQHKHRIYLCQYLSGEPNLPQHAPEYLHMSGSNRFKPRWMPIADLPGLPFTYWQPLKNPLIEALASDFAGQLMIVTTNAAR